MDYNYFNYGVFVFVIMTTVLAGQVGCLWGGIFFLSFSHLYTHECVMVMTFGCYFRFGLISNMLRGSLRQLWVRHILGELEYP